MRRFVYDFLKFVLKFSGDDYRDFFPEVEHGSVKFTEDLGNFIMGVSVNARKYIWPAFGSAKVHGIFEAQYFRGSFELYVRTAAHRCQHTLSLHVCNLLGFTAESALMFYKENNMDGIRDCSEVILDMLHFLDRPKSERLRDFTLEELLLTEFLMFTNKKYSPCEAVEYYRRRTFEENEKQRLEYFRQDLKTLVDIWHEILEECEPENYNAPVVTNPFVEADDLRLQEQQVVTGQGQNLLTECVRESWSFVDAFLEHALKTEGIKWHRKSGDRHPRSRYFSKDVGDDILTLSLTKSRTFRNTFTASLQSMPFNEEKFSELFFSHALTFWSGAELNCNFMKVCWMFCLGYASAKELYVIAGKEGITAAATSLSSFINSFALGPFMRHGGYAGFVEFVHRSTYVLTISSERTKVLEREVQRRRKLILKRIKKVKRKYSNWQEAIVEEERCPDAKVLWLKEQRWTRLP